jgi:hypothetical protein
MLMILTRKAYHGTGRHAKRATGYPHNSKSLSHSCPFVVQIFPASRCGLQFLAFSAFFAVICPSLQTRNILVGNRIVAIDTPYPAGIGT